MPCLPRQGARTARLLRQHCRSIKACAPRPHVRRGRCGGEAAVAGADVGIDRRRGGQGAPGISRRCPAGRGCPVALEALPRAPGLARARFASAPGLAPCAGAGSRAVPRRAAAAARRPGWSPSGGRARHRPCPHSSTCRARPSSRPAANASRRNVANASRRSCQHAGRCGIVRTVFLARRGSSGAEHVLGKDGVGGSIPLHGTIFPVASQHLAGSPPPARSCPLGWCRSAGSLVLSGGFGRVIRLPRRAG